MSGDYPLMHPWNGSDDGHDCADCHPESIWKCDRPAHDEAEEWRTETMTALKAGRQKIAPHLAEMQRTRRKALDESLHKGFA